MAWYWLAALDWKTIAAVVAVVIGIPTIITLLHTRVIIPVVTAIKYIWDCVFRAEAYMAILDGIAKEFKPNGGSSLKDSLNRIESHQLVTDTKIQALMNYNQIAAFQSNQAGEFVWLSDNFLNLLQLHRERAYGLGWLMSVKDADRQRVQEEWQRAVSQGRDFFLTFDVGIENTVRVIAKAYLIKDSLGTPKGFIGTLEPV